MRAIVVAGLLLLGGCYSIRHRNDPDVVAAAGGTPAAAKHHKHKDKPTKEVLPTGLGGDTEHRAYTVPPS